MSMKQPVCTLCLVALGYLALFMSIPTIAHQFQPTAPILASLSER